MDIDANFNEKPELKQKFLTKVFDGYVHPLINRIFSIVCQEEVTDFAKNILWETFLAIDVNEVGAKKLWEIYSDLIENEQFQTLRDYLENLKKTDQSLFEILEIKEIAELLNIKIIILGQKIKDPVISEKKCELIFVNFSSKLFFVSKYQALIPFIKDELNKLFEEIRKENESLWFAYLFSLEFVNKLSKFPDLEYENLKEELIKFQIDYFGSLIPKYFASKLSTLNSEKQISKLIFGEKNKGPKDVEKAKEQLIKWLQKIDTFDSKMCISDILCEVKPSEIKFDPMSSMLQKKLIEEKILLESENKRNTLLKNMKSNIKGNAKTYEILEKLYPNDLKLSENISPKKKFFILPIDGGGMKGIIPLVILCWIEKRTSRFISDCFDFIGGTSVGSIIATNLLCPYSSGNMFPKYSAWEILYNMLSKCDMIFPSTFNFFGLKIKYKSDSLLRFLDESLGERRMDESIKPLLIPTCTHEGITIKHCSLTSRYLMKDVAMASSSAPTFFPPHRLDGISHIDGGVTTNNPALILYDYATVQLKIDPKDIILVSLGTGKYVTNMPNRNWLWAKDGVYYTIAAQVKKRREFFFL